MSLLHFRNCEVDAPHRVIFTTSLGMGCVEQGIANQVLSGGPLWYEDADFANNRALIEKTSRTIRVDTSKTIAPTLLLDKMLPPVSGKKTQSGKWYEVRRFLAITYCSLDEPNISQKEMWKEYEILKEKLSELAWKEVDVLFAESADGKTFQKRKSHIFRDELRKQYSLFLANLKR